MEKEVRERKRGREERGLGGKKKRERKEGIAGKGRGRKEEGRRKIERKEEKKEEEKKSGEKKKEENKRGKKMNEEGMGEGRRRRIIKRRGRGGRCVLLLGTRAGRKGVERKREIRGQRTR